MTELFTTKDTKSTKIKNRYKTFVTFVLFVVKNNLRKSVKSVDKKTGFTMVELLVALMIASIVLAAVSTLAGATVAADNATDQMGREQTHLRQVSMRLTDLIRRANRVTVTGVNGFLLWHDVNADGWASAAEVTTVMRGADGNVLTIGGSEVHSKCQNISFAYDTASPDTRFITVSFDITENGQTQRHSINAHLWASDKHRKF